jgi:hypothetical protein
MQVTGRTQYIARGGGVVLCCFLFLPVCVYKFLTHYLNNVILYNSLGPLARESPCIMHENVMDTYFTSVKTDVPQCGHFKTLYPLHTSP